MKKYLFVIVIMIPVLLQAQENSQWRSKNRDGIYHETGLLKQWPAEGPQMLWKYEGLGEGHTSVAIANDKVYITGMTDSTGFLYTFDMKGDLLRKKAYGKEWSRNYNGSRSTVCVNDGCLYIFTGHGVLMCLDEKTQETIWKKDLFNDFDGKNVKFGTCESPLIVGNLIYATPGGTKNNFIALNKKTGDFVWSSEGKGKDITYCSPQYIGDQSIPIVLTATLEYLIGFHAETGEILWTAEQKNQYDMSPNTPIYEKGMIFSTTGGGTGSVMLRLTNGGKNVEQVWKHELDNKMGGAVKVGNFVYGSGEKNRYWYCLDWRTGEMKYKDNTIGVGNVISADGMLYCYSDKGEMALVKATPEKFDLAGKFKITLGTEQYWAHPVIDRGVLYVRHGDALMAYKIK